MRDIYARTQKTGALYLTVLLFSWLPPYRVLMVSVYDRTKSLLVVMLMHVTLVVGQFVLLPTGISGAPVVTYDLVFAAALWVLVVVVFLAKEGTSRTEPKNLPTNLKCHRLRSPDYILFLFHSTSFSCVCGSHGAGN
jgi:hypothetical protein